jgi:predicted ArsR family transcriptional regulator
MTAIPDPELARVLATPLRRRIFDLVASAGHPVSVSELTEELGCNHNAVRQHLVQLRAAGLVDEATETRTDPGRPRLLYTLAVRPNPYARLAGMLTRVIRERATPRAVGRDEGRALAERAADEDVVDVLETETAALGFAPHRVERRQRVDLVLDACPFADVAAADPRTVCALHRGLAEGIVDGVGGARVDTFVAHDPYEAGCVIGIRRAK